MGIDPGIERVGYAFLSVAGSEYRPISYGLIHTSKDLTKSKRIYQIYQDLTVLIERNRPELLGIESIIFAKNVKTGMIVSEVRGAILVLAESFGIPVVEFSPLEVKSSICGYGKASKGQVQNAVKMVLSLSEIPKPDDVADALAIAFCASNRQTFAQSIRASENIL